MIKLKNVVLASPKQMEFIIEGMRNPMNSWEKSDTCFSDESCVNCYDSQRNLCDKDSFFRKDEKLGSNDHSLMQRLSNAGTEHRKYMRMNIVKPNVPDYTIGELSRPNDVELIFDDSRDLDTFIDALLQLQKYHRESVGEWRVMK